MVVLVYLLRIVEYHHFLYQLYLLVYLVCRLFYFQTFY
nr:MAG TPA: hypothetical protein [Caudoviricetes sp.]